MSIPDNKYHFNFGMPLRTVIQLDEWLQSREQTDEKFPPEWGRSRFSSVLANVDLDNPHEMALLRQARADYRALDHRIRTAFDRFINNSAAAKECCQHKIGWTLGCIPLPDRIGVADVSFNLLGSPHSQRLIDQLNDNSTPHAITDIYGFLTDEPLACYACTISGLTYTEATLLNQVREFSVLREDRLRHEVGYVVASTFRLLSNVNEKSCVLCGKACDKPAALILAGTEDAAPTFLAACDQCAKNGDYVLNAAAARYWARNPWWTRSAQSPDVNHRYEQSK